MNNYQNTYWNICAEKKLAVRVIYWLHNLNFKTRDSFHTCNCFQSLDFDELGWTKYTKHKPQLGKDSTANNVSAALPLLRSYKSWWISEIMDFNSIKNSAWSVTWRNSMLKSNQDPGTTVPLEQTLCFIHTHLVVHTPLWWSIYHWWWLF